MVKTYVITSAQYNSPIHTNLSNSIKQYCKVNDAELIIIPMSGRSHKDDTLDTRIDLDAIIAKSVRLNSNIRVSDYAIKPQQIDPSTGMGRFTQTQESTIFASPKQRLKVVPTSNVNIPRMMWTTGALTKPAYNDNRIGNIALQDHVYGGLVVNVMDDKTYHVRPLKALQNGTFIDLGVKYDGEKEPSKANIEAIVFGDWHLGDTNPLVNQANYNLINEMNPKRIILHDVFNGHSVNHHNMDKSVTRAIEKDKNSLERELSENHSFLSSIGDGPHKTIIVASNHHEFLNRYLESGRYINDPENLRMATKLIPDFIDGKNPYEVGVKQFGALPKDVKFLRRDEDYKVLGWQLGAHGDKGVNGARPGINSTEAAFGKSITGHTHSPELLRNTVVVGTSTNLRLNYTEGPSTWMNTHALLYDNGQIQLVNVINGKYRP